MSDGSQREDTDPFEGVTELREAHANLLKTYSEQLGQHTGTESEALAFKAIEPQITEFLSRGAATGAFLEDIKERTLAQGLLDYWVSTLSHFSPETRDIRTC